MSSTNKTPKFNLPQWIGSDYLKREEMNRAFLVVDEELQKLNNSTPDRISILEQGADPTFEDNSPFIQLALEEAKNNGGGTVYIPSGIWKIKSPLIIYSNTKLMLETNAVIQRNADIPNMIRNYDDGTTTLSRAVQNVSITGGAFDGNDTAFPSVCYVMAFSRFNDIEVNAVEFKNIKDGNFIIAATGTYLTVEFCHFHDYHEGSNAQEAIQLLAPINNTVFPFTTVYGPEATSFITISNNRFERIHNGIATRVVSSDVHSRILAHDNIFYDVYAAIDGINWELVQIRDNHIDLCHNGIKIASGGNGSGGAREVYYIKIEKNVVRSASKLTNGSSGIIVLGSTTLGRYVFVSVQNNNVSYVERHSIDIEWCDSIEVNGNIVGYSGYGGIYANACRYGSVSSNNVRVSNRKEAGWYDITIGNSALAVSDTTQLTASNNTADTMRISKSNVISVLGNMILTASKLLIDAEATNIKRKNNWIGTTFEETAG